MLTYEAVGDKVITWLEKNIPNSVINNARSITINDWGVRFSFRVSGTTNYTEVHNLNGQLLLSSSSYGGWTPDARVALSDNFLVLGTKKIINLAIMKAFDLETKEQVLIAFGTDINSNTKAFLVDTADILNSMTLTFPPLSIENTTTVALVPLIFTLKDKVYCTDYAFAFQSRDIAFSTYGQISVNGKDYYAAAGTRINTQSTHIVLKV